MTVLLVRLYDADRSIMMVNSTVLSGYCADQFSNDAERRKDSKACLAQCLESDALLIDDLGKERSTERVETELYRILEHRTTSLLPTLITSNLGIGDLLEKFSPDQGPAIARRIAEFSKIVRL